MVHAQQFRSRIVQLYCCRALHAIVYHNADARTAAIQHNALAAVTDALAKFHGDSSLQKSCNVAMDAIFPTASSSFYSGVIPKKGMTCIELYVFFPDFLVTSTLFH